MNNPLKKYWREAVIVIMALLIIFPFWRNYMKQCPIITETVIITDTCWMTAYVKVVPPVRIIRIPDISGVIRDTVYETIFGPIAGVDSTETYQSVYLDTISIGAHRLSYAHLVTGSLDSSIYDLFVRQDTIIREISRPTVVYKEPWLELSATAHSQGDNFVPGIQLKSRKYQINYGFDLVQGRHNLGIGYRFWKF
jgi:hypothetical protein